MSGRRAVLWVVCTALVLYTLPSAAAHLTGPTDASYGFGGPGVNADPCRWSDDGTEHDDLSKISCVVGTGDDKHDGVAGTYVAEPDTFFTGLGACADHPLDAFRSGAKKDFGDVGCNVIFLNVPEPFFWDVDGDDCYNTLNPAPAQQERKGSKGCSSKKVQGLESISLDPTVFPAGFASAGGALCDLEVLFGAGTDETVIDNSKKNTGSMPDGTWDDGGIGGVCHTAAGFYTNEEWNSPGCAGIDDQNDNLKSGVTSDNKVAHAEDWVSGDSVWISATCNFVGETGGGSPLLSSGLALINNHLGSNTTDPIGGAAGNSWELSNFLLSADTQGANCFYGSTQFSGTSTTPVPDPNPADGESSGETVTTPSASPSAPSAGQAVPFGDDEPLVNCALETLTHGTTAITCSKDAIADVANYGHGGGHDTYPNFPAQAKGEVHLNHLVDTNPSDGLSVIDEVNAGVAYPDDPTDCQNVFDVAPTAIVFVYDTAVFTDGVWAEAGDQVVNPGNGPVSLHPVGVIPASGGWVDSTPNFGDSTTLLHCDEDGHYEGGVQAQADGNEDNHVDDDCEEIGGNDEGHPNDRWPKK